MLLLAAVCVTGAQAGPPPAGIPTDVATPLGQLVQTGGGPVSEADRAFSCAEMAGGTVGARELPAGDEVDTGNGLAPGDRTDAPRDLPAVVPFKTGTETFNRRYQFVARSGRIWFRSNVEVTKIVQPWRELPVPPCLYGQVTGVQVDDDELMALDSTRRIFLMDHAYRAPELFNWSTRWGPLFWTGPGRALAANSAWAWSVLSPREDRDWTDGAGNRFAVGADKVSHVWMLEDGGRRLAYADPWLANDDSYEMCGPHRGRFTAVNLAASGSTIFVIGRYGDLYTRLFDFDISGSDAVFFAYSYDNQRGKKRPKIQLPSPAWIRQPKVPGTITNVISIEKHGIGSRGRTLRVEGRDVKGRTGYWQKEITAKHWTFTRTARPLIGRPLSNPRGDTSARGLGGSLDRRYSSKSVEIENFNSVCTPSRVRVRLGSHSTAKLILHSVDGLRLTPRARRLSSEPRQLYGAIEVPRSTRASKDKTVKAWIQRTFGSRRYTTVTVEATTGTLKVGTVNWTLKYDAGR